MWSLDICKADGKRMRIALGPSNKIRFGGSVRADVRTANGQEFELSLIQNGSRYWVKLNHPDGFRLGDLAIREGMLFEDLPFRIGDIELKVIKTSLAPDVIPRQPARAQHWLTRSALGRAVLKRTHQVAQTQIPVHVFGETGTGKELIAHLVHYWSDRSHGPFVPVNCGSLPTELAESELFGHARGAFTGATQKRCGAILKANGGTLFLDEVGDLAPDVQVKLLRFLENGEIRAIGSDENSHVRVRLISATHHPLEKLVKEGKFRKDLYYRLACAKVHIPPLRERSADVKFLAKHFAGLHGKHLSIAAIGYLLRLKWHGNTRELKHAVAMACNSAGPARLVIEPSDFHSEIEEAEPQEFVARFPGMTLRELEREYVLQTLCSTNGNRTVAASRMGIARSTLFEKMRRFEIDAPSSRRPKAWNYRPAALLH